MNVRRYKERLLETEKSLTGRIARASEVAADLAADGPRDLGDASVADIAATDHFTGSERDSATLQQVRDALQRIEEGTFGRCLADGKPIDAKRLDAVPWAGYCLEHQDLLESSSG